MYGMEGHRVWAQGPNVGGGGAGNTTIPFNYNNPGVAAAAAPAFIEGGQPIYSNFWQPPHWKGSCYQGSPFISNAAEQIQCSNQMQLNLNSNHNRWSKS